MSDAITKLEELYADKLQKFAASLSTFSRIVSDNRDNNAPYTKEWADCVTPVFIEMARISQEVEFIKELITLYRNKFGPNLDEDFGDYLFKVSNSSKVETTFKDLFSDAERMARKTMDELLFFGSGDTKWISDTSIVLSAFNRYMAQKNICDDLNI